MKGFLRWLIAVSLAVGLAVGFAPTARADYSNNTVMEEVMTARNALFDYVDKTIFVAESDASVGFREARSVGSDEAINYFMELWRRIPNDTLNWTKSYADYIVRAEGYGYDMSDQRRYLQNVQVYGLPNLINAVPIAERVAFGFYASVSVQDGQAVVTPKFDRVTVVRAEIQNDKVSATIQVVNQTTGYVNEYTSSYPAIEPPGTPDLPPANPPTPKSFTKTYTPTISGSAKVGSTLTAKVKTWSPTASIKWQWLRNGEVVPGATTSKYKVGMTDVGTKLSVKVTGTKSGHTSVTKTSASTKVVVKGTLARGKVSVSGTRRVGKTLTAKTSKWSSGVTYHYQWYRNSTKITGAIAKTYILTPADKGKRIKVKVWTTRDGYNQSSSRMSSKTAKVKTGYLTKVTPTISGSATVGEVLTAKPGTWKPNTTTFSYQWYRSGKAIKGATKATYVLTNSDLGKTITVKVTAKAKGYYTASKTSAKTSKVVKAVPVPPTSPTPSVTPSPGPSTSPSASPSSSPNPDPTP